MGIPNLCRRRNIGYDSHGNTESTIDIFTGVTRTLSYDGLSRLKKSQIDATGGSHTRSTGYGSTGNIMGRTGRTGVGS